MRINKPVAMVYRLVLVIGLINNTMEENVYQCIIRKFFGCFKPVVFMKIIRVKTNKRID